MNCPRYSVIQNKIFNMATSKYKVTGFARFFLFMLFFIPIAYFGLSMAKGESPDSFVQKIKNKIENVKGFKFSENRKNDVDFNATISKKDEEIQKLKEELFHCQNSK